MLAAYAEPHDDQMILEGFVPLGGGFLIDGRCACGGLTKEATLGAISMTVGVSIMVTMLAARNICTRRCP